MDGRREEVLGLNLDETAVGDTLGEERDIGVGRGIDVPAEDGRVEGLDALEVGAGNLGPGDRLVEC